MYVNPAARNRHGEPLTLPSFLEEMSKIFNVRYFDNLEHESCLFIEGVIDGKEKAEAT